MVHLAKRCNAFAVIFFLQYSGYKCIAPANNKLTEQSVRDKVEKITRKPTQVCGSFFLDHGKGQDLQAETLPRLKHMGFGIRFGFDAGRPGIRILGDSAFLLEADIALTATEFGRQLHRVVIQQGLKTGSRSDASQSQRLTSARRLQATSDFRTAEAVIREAIEAAPESAEAWDALERLKTTQRDFQGVAGIRQERLAQNPPGPKEEASLRKLESRLEEEGEEGYWSWRMEDLQEREEGGEKISPVILARTYMGLDRTDEAFQELEAAVEKRDRNLLSLWTDPAWDSVRTDPRFRKIMMDIRRTQSSKGTRFPGGH